MRYLAFVGKTHPDYEGRRWAAALRTSHAGHSELRSSDRGPVLRSRTPQTEKGNACCHLKTDGVAFGGVFQCVVVGLRKKFAKIT